MPVERLNLMTETWHMAEGRAAGDERLRGYLAESHASLVALAYVLSGSRDQAQEVVQEVALQLLARDVRQVANLNAYARRAVVNECNTLGRRTKRRFQRQSLLLAEWHRDLRTQPDPFGRLEVMEALDLLSARQRTAVVLRFFVDVDDEEIGEVLGCSAVTVRSIVSRAVKKLRTALTEEA